MKSSLNSAKKSIGKISKKTSVFLLVFIMLFSFLFTPLDSVKAQMVVSDPGATAIAQAIAANTALANARSAADSAYKKAKTALGKLLLKAGAVSFQRVIRTALNKIAYDTATYLGSGDKGQKPLFITQGWGEYLGNIGDAAIGQYIEVFANNLGSAIGADCQRKYQICATSCNDSYSASSTDALIIDQLTVCVIECKTKANKCGGIGVNSTVGDTTTSAGVLGGINAASLTSLNMCQPSSLSAKVTIGLGLVQQQNPIVNCTASEMISNWGNGDVAQKIKDFKSENFLDDVKGMFNPTSNDLGIYMTARSDMAEAETGAKTLGLTDLAANKGWLTKKDASGRPLSVPGDAQTKAETTEASQKNSILRTTGDIVVDAANVFVNQFAITKFNDLMSKLGQTATQSSGRNSSLTNSESDSNVSYGQGNFKEALSDIKEATFGTKSDYNILANLTVCVDKNNPGPTDCVIDSGFMQAIAENKTVIEAINEGYINGNWQLTKDTIESAYSLRNVSILRKYRILPIGWEEAINRAYANSANIKKVTVMDLVSCFDATDSYNQYSSSFDTKDQIWCRGLVDPNWVLKAPLNYCSKQGVGAQIISGSGMITKSSLASGIYTASAYNFAREENYCADEKTCIKEKADGGCAAYGYCNEEKRTWNFSAESCDPIYNTCQSFTNSDSGKSFSYLENTLNYSGCNAESAGCRQYSVFGTYAADKGTVSWDRNQSIYLNKNADDCNSSDEACTELLRIKATWGSNLVMDADYNNENIGDASTNGMNLKDWSYWASNNASSKKVMIVDSSLEPGGGFDKSLKLEAARVAGNSGALTAGVYSDTEHSLIPENFQLTAGQAYTVSVDVYIAEGNKATVYMGATTADGFVQTTALTGNWQHLTATRVASNAYNAATFGVSAEGTGSLKVYIKNLKFEVSNYETGFNVYGSTYKVYEKLIPPYLESVCYNNISDATKDYTLKDNAPAACAKFARRCNREEAGCEKFIGVKDSIAVSAQVTSSDYCWGSCVGYNVFISKENYFNSPKAENMIPTTATTCNAEAVGCSEFTNLDELSAGGEAREYYSEIKQCIKPGQGTCGNFYSWEGTESGYQLRLYNLQQDNSGNPKVTADDSAACNQEIYNKAVSDSGYNADCREFYNSAGQIVYHLISKTITCSDNCHAYRMSEKNIDKTLTGQSACNAADAQNDPSSTNYHWDAAASVCYSCLNGGIWDTATGACIYQVIPGEGKTCTASKNGCREYNGNSGNNVRTVVSYDFESGPQAWTSNANLQTAPISSEKNGHSLLYNSGTNNLISADASDYAIEGKSYSIRFLAKANLAANLNIYFSDNDSVNPQRAQFSVGSVVVKAGGEWNIYQANLDSLDHAISGNETLTVEANNTFYLDDFVVTEIVDRYYLVSGSSKVPDVCSYDLNNVYQGSDYSLGCARYTDRANETHNLRKFSKLCSSSAVGCEQVIATQNYSPYGSGIWNDTNSNGACDSNEKDCVKVDRDQAIYAVFDSSKQCNSADLGCSLLGQGTTDGSSWSDVYKVNNPNLYSSVLCGQSEIGCEAWTTDDGSANYFRDPGNETCQYRLSHDPAVSGKAWYMIPTKKCDSSGDGSINTAEEKSGAVCANDNACSGKKCIIDNNDYPCQTTYFKTFGLGGAGNQVPVPSEQAGLCQATASGCTEYIDPVSKFMINLYNDKPTITISPNKLYILSVTGGTKDTGLTFTAGVKELLSNNTLSTTTKNISVSAKATSTRLMFASLSNSAVEISGGESGKIIELKEAVVDYQLQENIDAASCNGAVNFDNGCILFNERNLNGASGLTSLVGKFDAASSVDKQAPASCSSSGVCNANKLIKVSPNRVCSKWLDCRTYVPDPNDSTKRVCYAVGECSRLDDNNECVNFEDVAPGTVEFDNAGQNKDASGYYLLDKYHLSNMQEVGLNTDAHYDFEDSAPALSCKKVAGGECAFSKNISSDLLIREPKPNGVEAPAGYPAHGASYLKVPASYLVSPHSSKSTISIKPNQQYYLNFLVNTKNSGTNARIKIVSVSGNVETMVVDNSSFSSMFGWSRQVLPFKSPVGEIRIYLGADDSSSDRSVYFDDLNIEPVLEVGQNQYVARECRLYPTNDSLTCVNKNNNVLKDGLEGYCLEHDPNNKDVCLMWYPVDKISSERSLKSDSGYQGVFPLNYCTEVDGNFDLVKKVTGASVSDQNNRKNEAAWDISDIGNPENNCKMWVGCLDNYDENYITIQRKEYKGDTYCIPNPSKKIYFKTEASGIETSGENLAVDCTMDQGHTIPVLELYAATDGVYGDGGTSRTAILQTNGTYCEAGRDCDSYQDLMTEMDTETGIGNFSQFIRTVGSEKKFVYQEGWVEYDGKLQKISACSGDECSKINEETNATPPVRIYDYNNPPSDEDNLKYISGNDEEKIFRLTCNNFIQMVDSSGANMAWSARVGINPPYPTSTPPFFVDKIIDKNLEIKYVYYGGVADGNFFSSEHGISAYGRNRETTPFGAASWPDSLNLLSSEAIKLKNQFSAKNNENVLAGRPYGCSNYKDTDEGSGCSNIGYCSLDPSVYCLTGANGTTDYVSKKTCSEGGIGTCIPLWSNYLGAPDSQNNDLPDFKTILRTLFLKSYNSYTLSGGSYTSGDSTTKQGVDPCSNNKRPEAVYGLVASSTAAFNSLCFVSPSVGNISLNNQTALAKVSAKGIYGLKFTTVIDPEQQPLKEIYIDWGDGSTQSFTGQDNHPSVSDPHVFYHYYKGAQIGNIKIEIKDNWEITSKGTLKLN